MINFDEFETMDDGEIVLLGSRFISFRKNDDYVTLEGGFTLEELRQIVAYFSGA